MGKSLVLTQGCRLGLSWIAPPELGLGFLSAENQKLPLLPTLHQPQPIGLQDALDLIASMHRPWPGGVQLYIGAPMAESFARLFDLLVSQSQVVVGIGIGWRELQCRMVSLDRFRNASGFVEHVAQIEIGERI